MGKYKKIIQRATPYSNAMEIEPIDKLKIPPKSSTSALQEFDKYIEEDDTNKIKSKTRGAILQRHKKEWKELRFQMEELTKQKQKLSKRVMDQKLDRTSMGRDIRQLKIDLEKKQKDELDAYDKANVSIKDIPADYKFNLQFSYEEKDNNKDE